MLLAEKQWQNWAKIGVGEQTQLNSQYFANSEKFSNKSENPRSTTALEGCMSPIIIQ